MSREALYDAMTRGRDANTSYVATAAIDPTCDQLPDVQAERSDRDVLTQILATIGAELFAAQTLYPAAGGNHVTDDANADQRNTRRSRRFASGRPGARNGGQAVRTDLGRRAGGWSSWPAP